MPELLAVMPEFAKILGDTSTSQDAEVSPAQRSGSCSYRQLPLKRPVFSLAA